MPSNSETRFPTYRVESFASFLTPNGLDRTNAIVLNGRPFRPWKMRGSGLDTRAFDRWLDERPVPARWASGKQSGGNCRFLFLV